MNASRRARKRGNHIRTGAHSSDDHALLHVQAAVKAQEQGHSTPGPVNCPVCRPRPGVWDRSLAGKSRPRGESVKGPYPWIRLEQRAELERRPVERNE